MRRMKVAGLFAGSGAFEYALDRKGFAPRLLADIDPAARDVLKKHFRGVPIADDVRKLPELPPETEIVTAGFPCQNLSMVGDKSGIKGNKSGVVESIFPLIENSSVRTVIIENVYFMLRLASGDGMRWLVEQFEDRGFRWAYRVLDTMGFGLPQRRRRVYLVASHDLDPRRVLFADRGRPARKSIPSLKKPLGFYWTEGRTGVGFTVDGVPPLKAGSTIGIASPPAVLFTDGRVLTPSISACERLQGLPRDWTLTDSCNRWRGARWRLVGNAVSVPVAQWIASRIRKPEKPRAFETWSLEGRHRWPDAAWNVGAGRKGAIASDWPVSAKSQSIERFVDSSWSKLSNRALNGFIHRATSGRLKMPKGFLEALHKADRKDLAVA